MDGYNCYSYFTGISRFQANLDAGLGACIKKHHIFPTELSVQQERHTWEELYGILTQTVPRAQFVWTPSLYKVRDTNF